ncbi:IS66 Orf2 family protein [Paraburkholderia hospita]|jgi:transposase|uniref:IS66 Orf2 family protein n=1 Tax=Paraburkholderia hospita TaxID=169430 RepID=A0ABN0F9M1_9BURK|nr:IS66 Orf2 family protein [Paraburkholderia hospita]OUL73494.1 transposase [Paraburkholderia hospita]OUL84671.1 transposase [Paraburkholderia hospita]SEI28714.1 transposase [Paraburkholderia hospita]
MVGTKVDKTWGDGAANGAYKRPNFPTEFKRQLVEQSLEPGASVALIARSNDINANLLFKWRRLYLAGEYGLPTLPEGATPKRAQEVPSLLPVNVVAEAAEHTPPMAVDATRSPENLCEIEFDRARLRVCGNVSPDMLRLLIRELSR